MEWVDRNIRVPGNRNRVLTWGNRWNLLGRKTDMFLGCTKFNITTDKFDCELSSLHDLHMDSVTHWMEVEGPNVKA